MSDHDLKPSTVTDRPWIEAHRSKGTFPKPTRRSGKWLVFVERGSVDEVWAKVRRATEAGRLGHRSKVATGHNDFALAAWEIAAKKKPPSAVMSAVLASVRRRAGSRLICVYTYDWKDEDDVMRVRRALRRLGITSPIPYKTDEDTRHGLYVDTADGRRVGKYFA